LGIALVVLHGCMRGVPFVACEMPESNERRGEPGRGFRLHQRRTKLNEIHAGAVYAEM
jgi:hypothetical protein